MPDKITQLLEDVQKGEFKSLARAITIVENELDGYKDLLLQLPNTTSSRVVGITGPPGAGKSTLVSALLSYWTNKGKKVAVIAVDPSSPFNFGALLGDRIRMSEFYNNPNVYIRSLASRGALGGLNPKIIEVTDVVKAAPFDIILVETVGVGQSEVEVAGLADCTIVTLVPEAGDEVQTLKAGIMEIADVFIINKADRDAADALYVSLKTLAHEKSTDGFETPVLKTVATTNNGIDIAAECIYAFLQERSTIPKRKVQLLTEKCWQLIQAEKMKGFSKKHISEQLSGLLSEPSFNIYAFASDIIDKQKKN